MAATLEASLRTLFNSGRTPEFVLSALEGLGLEKPAPGEFLCGHNGILFAPPGIGAVVRIEDAQSTRSMDHTLIVPTLAKLNVGYADISITAGTRTADVGLKEMHWLNRELNKQGILWRDAKPEDVGRLPLATREHPAGLPVLIDPDYLRETGSALLQQFIGLGQKQKSLEDYGVDPMEARGWRGFIGGLQNSLKQAWETDQQTPGQHRCMTAFWNEARMDTADRFVTGRPALFCGWQETPDSPPPTRNIYELASRQVPQLFSAAARAANTARPV